MSVHGSTLHFSCWCLLSLWRFTDPYHGEEKEQETDDLYHVDLYHDSFLSFSDFLSERCVKS